MKFENLRKLVRDSYAEEFEKERDFIMDGVEGDPLRGMKKYSTDLQFNQYQNGIISVVTLQDYAYLEMKHQNAKKLHDTLKKIEMVENSDFVKRIAIHFSWSRPYCGTCFAGVLIDDKAYTKESHTATGDDRESHLVAQCFNENYGLLKYLYAKKNEFPNTPNRELLGYGSGFGALPYFESAVDMSSVVLILENLGFKKDYVFSYYGDTYHFIK